MRTDDTNSTGHARLLDAVRRTEAVGGPQAVTLLERMIHDADRSNWADIAGHARLTLAHMLRGNPAGRDTFTSAITWLAGQLDADAPWIGWWERCHILQQTSWLVTDLLHYPDVPLTTLNTYLDDLRHRAEHAGYGLESSLACAYQIAQHTDGHTAADPLFRVWTALPRDELSDELNIGVRLRVEHMAAMGRDQDALDLAFPCMVLEMLPISVARVGLPDQAANLVAHALACAADITDPGPQEIPLMICLLNTLRRGGAIEAGLDLLRWWPSMLPKADCVDPLTRLDLLTSAYAIVARAVGAEMGSHVLVTRTGERLRLDELAHNLHHGAARLAAQFDARNCTDRYTARLARFDPHAAPPTDTDTYPVLPLAGRRDGAHGIFLAGRMSNRNEHPFAPRTDDLDDLDVIGLNNRLDEVTRWGGQANYEDVRTYWIAHRDQVLARSGRSADPARRHSAAKAAIDLDAATLWQPHRTERIDQEWARVATRYEAIGEHAEALLARQLIHIDALDLGRAQAIIPEVDACGTRDQRLQARLRLTGLVNGTQHLSADEIDALLTPPLTAKERSCFVLRAALPMPLPRLAQTIDECLDMLQPGEWPSLRACLLARRALVRLRLADQRDNAFADQLAAEHAASEAGELDTLANVLLQRARVVFDDDFAGGERNMLRARWAALQAGHLENQAAATAMLVELLQGEGHLDEAYVRLRDALSQLDDDAIPALQRRHDDLLQLRAQLRRAGAHLIRLRENAELAEPDGERAEAMMRAAIDDLDAVGDAPGLAMAHFELAELLTDTDALEALHEYDLADELAVGADTPRLRLVIARERVHATYLADGPDAALATIAAARRRNEQMQLAVIAEPDLRESLDWDFEIEELQLTESRVRVLRAAKRIDAAMALVGDLTTRYQQTQHPTAAVRTQILRAELLMDQGKRQAGLDQFRIASVGARELGNADLARFAAMRGATRLEEAGDGAGAKAFWESLMGESEQ